MFPEINKTERRAEAFRIQDEKIDRAWEEYKEETKPFVLKRYDAIQAANEEYLQAIKEIDV